MLCCGGEAGAAGLIDIAEAGRRKQVAADAGFPGYRGLALFLPHRPRCAVYRAPFILFIWGLKRTPRHRPTGTTGTMHLCIWTRLLFGLEMCAAQIYISI